MKKRVVYPKVAWLVLTPRCNNRCKQCYQGEDFSVNKDMSLAYAKKVLYLLGKLKVKNCILIGGEPTLYLKLNEVVCYGKKQGVRMSIITNGSVFSNKEKLKACVDNGLSGFTVSIEGPRARIHDSQTCRKGSFDQAIQALKNGLDAKVTVASITTLSQTTKDVCMETYQKMREIGLSTIVLNVCTPCLNLSNKECLLPPKEAAEKLEEIFLSARDDIKNLGVKLKLVTPLPLCLFNQDFISEMKETGFLRHGCGCQMFYGSGIAFNFDGDIIPCCHWVNCSLGNAKKLWGNNISLPDFKEWWREKEPAEFRKELIRYPSSRCVGCKDWGTNCIGGCPLFWLQYDAEKTII